MEIMTDTENTFTAAEQNERVDSLAAARDFVKKAAEAAMERTTSFHAGVEKATASVEQTLVNSVGEVAKLSRQAQQAAAYEDAEAFLSGVNKLASANGIGEAVQIYVEYIRAGSDTAISRARATSDYVGKILADGAKSLQANISKAGVFTRKAA
jgi:hypothetical protein